MSRDQKKGEIVDLIFEKVDLNLSVTGVRLVEVLFNSPREILILCPAVTSQCEPPEVLIRTPTGNCKKVVEGAVLP